MFFSSKPLTVFYFLVANIFNFTKLAELLHKTTLS